MTTYLSDRDAGYLADVTGTGARLPPHEMSDVEGRTLLLRRVKDRAVPVWVAERARIVLHEAGALH